MTETEKYYYGCDTPPKQGLLQHTVFPTYSLVVVVIPLQNRGCYNQKVLEAVNNTVVMPLQNRGCYNFDHTFAN